MATYINGGVLQVFNNATGFASSGTIETYIAGTSTHRTTYPTLSDAINETNPNAWPVTLDSRGSAVIAVSGPTDITIKDSAGTVLEEILGMDQLLSDILDEDGNVLLHFEPLANAVDYISIGNGVSGGTPPTISSAGSSTNIALRLAAKGSSSLTLDAGSTGTVEIGTNSTGNINLKRATSITGNLSVSGNITATGSIAATTTASVGTNLTVTGTSTLTGAVTLGSYIYSAGLIQGNAGLNINTSTPVNFLVAGVIAMWPYAGAPPSGWLFCTGQAVSRTTYASLFSVCGTTYGPGDGSTTFNLPDFQRRQPFGWGGVSTGVLGSTLGSTGGAETVVLTTGNYVPNTVMATNAIVATGADSGTAISVYLSSSAEYLIGSSTPVNILNPSLVTAFIIRAF